jgi:hypothetical protein
MGSWDWISIYDETGKRGQACSVGRCTSGGWIPIHGSHTYTAYVAANAPEGHPPEAPYAVSNSVTVTNVGWIGSVTLTDRSTTPGQHVLDAQVQAGAYVDGYPYWLSVYDETGKMIQACSVGFCGGLGVTVPSGAVRYFRAYVAQGAPMTGPPTNDVSAVSEVLVVTDIAPEEVLDSPQMVAAVAAFEARFATAGEGCMLLGAIFASNVKYKASASDVNVECNAFGVRAALALAVATVGIAALADFLEASNAETTPVPAPPTPQPPQQQPRPRAPWGPTKGVSLDEFAIFAASLVAKSLIGPSTLDPQPTPDQLQQTVRQCMSLAQSAELGSSAADAADECARTRLLVVGGMASKGREAAEHDLEVIQSAPNLFQLTHLPASENAVPRDWYKRTQYASACAGAQAGQQCDEYPLYATVEGGPSAYDTYGSVVLKPISADDNQAEGRAYGAMTNSAACEFKPEDEVFLVVPLPTVEVPSFFVCPQGRS